MTAKHLTLVAFMSLGAPAGFCDQDVALPNTKPLTEQGDLSEKMLDGMHRYIDRKVAGSVRTRPQYWQRDLSSPEAYEKSIQSNRDRFKNIIGVTDQRLPMVVMERFGDDDKPALVAETDRFSVYQVRWPALDGITGEGLLLKPKSKAVGLVVALGDADQDPEMLVGLTRGVPTESQFARRLVENGFVVVVPTLISRADHSSGNPRIKMINQPHREWIYRSAYLMGRHIIGYEVQKVLAVVDWFKQTEGANAKIGIAGYGEGGLLALYAAAVDTRIEACLVSGYFDAREQRVDEPVYRNVWGLLREFGDAEIATLVAPRALVIEYSSEPKVEGPPEPPAGQRSAAAPGRLRTPEFRSVLREFNRIATLTRSNFQPKHLVRGPADTPISPGSPKALEEFSKLLGVRSAGLVSGSPLTDRRKSFDARARQARQVKELQDEIQEMLERSDGVRDQFFRYAIMPELTERQPAGILKAKTRSAERFVEGSQKFRKLFWEEILGKLDDPMLLPNPHSRKVYDRPKWTGYEVQLDVFPDVFAWGVLLVPKDVRPGEKRPVVVCQHGLEGLPKDVIEGDVAAYHDFAARLAELGYIVFAPHNNYRLGDRFRWLNRKANTVKASMFSFTIAQHDQILRWLETLQFVDERRMAFYGLSYGGTTAMMVPPVLERYCLSICSANFNEDIRKIGSTKDPSSYMFLFTWEVPFFNLGNTFGHAERAYLMLPRPFMVERGQHDTVALDRWVSYEFAKVRWLYTQLGLADKTTIEYFNGSHTINGDGTFEFLRKHLDWRAK